GGQPWRDSFTPEWDPQTSRTGSGILALALAALVVAWRRKETWFFFGLALVCLCAGFDAPPVINLLHKLPLFNMALNERLAFAASCSLSILAALAVDALAAGRSRSSARRAAVVGAVVAIGLGAGTWA